MLFALCPLLYNILLALSLSRTYLEEELVKARTKKELRPVS
jgi:hypothetical protein